MKNKVFLGGTCNNSNWRDKLIPYLTTDYFNPVVEDWTPECQSIEEIEKVTRCNIHLYVITSSMKGVFSIAEAVHSAHLTDKTTIFCVDPTGFDDHEMKSLIATAKLINSIGGNYIIMGDGFDPSALNFYINKNL